MELHIKPKALRVIIAVGDFVESKNTPGSGERFIRKFTAEIERLAKPNVTYFFVQSSFIGSQRIFLLLFK